MATLVSPMRGAAVAIPAASRCSTRTALDVLFDRLSIAVDDDEESVDDAEDEKIWFRALTANKFMPARHVNFLTGLVDEPITI